MASKKRRTPPAVTEQLERRRRLTSTLAVRQAGALGKSARTQLNPLLKPAPSAEGESAEVDFSRHIEELRTRLMASPPTLSFPLISFPSTWPSMFVSAVMPSAPSIDTAKLDALKAAEPRKVAPRVPDMVEVITGWRAWALSRSGRLEALGRSTVWPVRQALVAECDNAMSGGRHFAPAWDCTCGVWAFKDLDRLVAAVGSGYGGVRILGTVSLWGRVVETENGYRAQYAYPAELWLFDESLEELGRIYDVPVRTIRG